MNFEKHYYFKIDDDEIYFSKIMLDKDRNPVSGFEGREYGFENNPTILDVTHLNYIPIKGSVWDGECFKLDGIDNTNLDTQEVRLTCPEYSTLAFLLNDKLFSCMSWCADAPTYDAIMAASKSNPQIIYKEIEVK